jgi:hypothetical protein
VVIRIVKQSLTYQTTYTTKSKKKGKEKQLKILI